MSSNDEIKNHLLFISNKIDETIRQYREAKSQELNHKKQEEYYNENSPNYISKISSLKSQVESIQKNLEEVYNIDKVNQLESDIKKKEKILKDLKGERDILNNVVKEQNKGINEYLSKFNSAKEQNELSSQIKEVKDENHKHKEIYKDISNKIKAQKNKIDALEKKCNIIKQNIEFQKKKQMKEVKKTLNDEKSDEEDDEFGGDIEKMEEKEKNLINEINIEEKNFRMEINEQNDIMKKINVDIKKVDFKIKNLKQEKKLDEIKKKTRTKNRSTTKYQPNSNSNGKGGKNADIKRRLSNYKQDPSSNNANNKTNKMSFYTDKRNNLKTPNFIMKNSEKYTKPFEIKKFNDLSSNYQNNDEKNNTMFNENKNLQLPLYNDLNNADTKSSNYEKKNMRKKSNKGISALKEIENLKNEIQSALKNNIVILNDNEDILTDYGKLYERDESKKNNTKKFSANQTGGFAFQINNVPKEKEEEGEINDIVYKNENQNNNNNNEYKKTVCIQNERRIKDYQLNGSEISEETKKRKPFDKINFK